ncbi:MAG: DEAD/DEAH box helicase family protein [Phycisphaerales bacterium]|nr:DEAD/DEAH box helicase family protein [Phycisphaerales bacterium]
MNYTLKGYQSDCLKVLDGYLRLAREKGAKAAFNASDSRPLDALKRRSEYAVIPSWPESEAFPYVCLRVPTGGGKTIIAAHAVGVATKAYLQAERAMVLWLAPSNTIVEQTLKALRNRRHPYRTALDEAFKGCVTVLSTEEALSVKPGTLDADTTIVVATMQTFRVTAKEGRLVYRGNGELMDHFANLAPAQQALLEQTDADGNPVAEGGVGGTFAKSLANVFRLRMPLVIVDEAHNARSDLSYDTLRRFNPSGIIEFTATPAAHTRTKVGSNVLFSVSASELKAAQMIKMPIRLVERGNPHEAISSAITKREELERLAADEEKTSGEYIRPIVLFQAQSKSEGEDRITPDVLKAWLIKDYHVNEDEVAIRTGEKDQLPEEPLLRSCPLKFVITVNALREGWDCPFAYVLCSVANLSAKGAVEQLLGRVLRLPYAKAKQTDALNEAYAYVTSKEFGAAAASIKDALVESGFERYEAEAAVSDEGRGSGGGSGGAGPLFGEPVAEVVTTKPSEKAIAALPKDVREALSFQTRADTKETEIVWTGGLLTTKQADALAAVFEKPEDRRAVAKVRNKTEGRPTNPAYFGDPFNIPQLAVADSASPKGWTLFDPTDADIAWTLDECDAALGEDALDPAKTTATGATIDVKAEGKLAVELLTRLAEQMQLRDLRGPKTPEAFVDWLDAELKVPEATQPQKRAFLDRVFAHLIAKRGLPFETLLPLRWRLVAAIDHRIQLHRIRAQHATYQAVLFGRQGPAAESRPEVVFEFPRKLGLYPAPRNYDGDLLLRKHYYANIGAMEPEEARCAALIADHPNVAYWVRNLTSGAFAFRLPLADRGFYPDFVAMLRDGQVVAVEYKGEVYRTNDDSKEKELIGNLWAARSAGRCRFALVGSADMQKRLGDLLAP